MALRTAADSDASERAAGPTRTLGPSFRRRWRTGRLSFETFAGETREPSASAGWTEKDLQEAGLCRPARTPSDRAIDAFYSRAIFPVRDAKGRVCGFAGRVLPGAPDDAPKYVNTAETRLFSKRRLL